MSDLLIKNMEMPSCCNTCWECDYGEATDRFYCSVQGTIINCIEPPRPADCPLVEVPSHGPLADIDKLKESAKTLRLEKKVARNAIQIIELDRVFADFIDAEPIVMEASK